MARRCTACGLRTPADTVTLVMTLLAHGCLLHAIIVAFVFDERAVAAWMARVGIQNWAAHTLLVEQPHNLGRCMRTRCALRNRGHGLVALAMMVSTRLWLAGAVSAHRDLPRTRHKSSRQVRARCYIMGC